MYIAVRYITMNWVLLSLLLLLPAASWCAPEYPEEGIHVKSEEEHLEGIDVQTKQDDLAGIEAKVGEEKLNGIDVNVEVKNLAGIDVKAGNDHLIGIVVNDEDNNLSGVDVKTEEGKLVLDVRTKDEHLTPIDIKSDEEHILNIDVKFEDENLSENVVKLTSEHLSGIEHDAVTKVILEDEHRIVIDVKSKDQLTETNFKANDQLTETDVKPENNHLEGIDEKATHNHMFFTPVETVEGVRHSEDDVKTEEEHLSQLAVKSKEENLSEINIKAVNANEPEAQDENLEGIDINVKEVDRKGIDKMIVDIFEPEEEDPTEVEVADQTDLDSIQVQEADPLSPALNDNSAALNKSDDTVGESQYGILMTRLMDMIGVGEAGTNPTDIDSNAEEEHSSEIDVKAEEEFTSGIDVKSKEHLSQDEISMISNIYMSDYEDPDDEQLTEIDLTNQDENRTGNDAAVEENDSSEIGLVEQSKAFVSKLFDMIGLRNSDNSPPKTCSSSSPLYYADLTDPNCNHFYHCSDGHEPYLQECPTGTRWAPKLHTCDYEENVLCPRTPSDDMSVARCEFKGEGTGGVFGEVLIIQVKDDLNGSHFQGKIIGLAPGLHGFHVHAVGNISNDCKAAGGHFNPNNVTHGRKDDDVRHVGDLGNLEAEENGAMLVDLWDSVALLNGTNSIIGKAIVVHEGQDDEGTGGNDGSLVHGNAGARAGCCIIEEV